MTVNIGKLEIPALLSLRDQIDARLTTLGKTLSAQLASLGITGALTKGGRPAGNGKRAHALRGLKRPAKYRDPETGKTWAGVGMTPLWMKQYEAAGKSRDQFTAGANGTAPTKKRRPKKAARK